MDEVILCMMIHDMDSRWQAAARLHADAGDLLHMRCEHPVFGFAWDPALEGRNRLADDRLFMVFPDSQTDGWLAAGGRRRYLRAGTVWLQAAGGDLAYRFGPGLRMFACQLRFPQLPLATPFAPGLQQLTVESWLWPLLDACLAQVDASRVCQLHGLLRLIVAHRLRPGLLAEAAHLQDRFRPLLDLLDTIDARTRIEDCAACMDMKTNACAQAFRRASGRSLGSLMQERLSRRACRLLLSDARSVATIAEELRFSDPFHFSRFVKRHTGLSPTALRQSWGR